MRDLCSRREVVGGGVTLGLLALAGCRSNSSAEALPAPVRPAPELAQTPPVRPGPAPLSHRPVPLGSEPSVLPRSAWTRVGVARPQDINPLGGVVRITIHHDGMDTFTATDSAAAAQRIETIRHAHVNGRRFADIGYHYIVDPAGRVWEGRSIRYQGAHVQDHNENNLGVMCLGNFDNQAPTRAQQAALDAFIAGQMRRYRVPITRVHTHQELMPTACPGRNLQRYLIASRSTGGSMRLAAAELDPSLVIA